MKRFFALALITPTALVASAQDRVVARFEAELTNLGVVSPIASSDDPNDPSDDLIPRGPTTIDSPAPTPTDPDRRFGPGTPLFSPIDTGVSGSAAFDLIRPAGGGPLVVEYAITLRGVDLLDPGVAVPSGVRFDEQTPGDRSNDLAAIHLHSTRLPGGLTREFNNPAPHAANLFGIPTDASNPTDFPFGGDDEDLFATQAGADVLLTGVWEDGDEVLRGFLPASTRRVSDSLDALFAGQLHLLVHTLNEEAIGGATGPAIGGRLVRVAVPEPAALAVLAVGGLLAGLSRRR